MRTLSIRLLAVAVVALVASPAFAQQGGGGFQLGGVRLLQNKSVQEELKMTDEQKEAVKKVADEYGPKLREAFQNMDREKAQEIQQAQTKASLATLKPEQVKRFKQIDLQVSGLVALGREDVQKELKLTDEQKNKIKEISENLQKEMREIFQDAGQDREKRQEAQKKIATMRTEAFDKVKAALTDEQKATWKEMVGEKFEIKLEPGRPGGGRGKGKGADK
jgi:Spy/CpxP family protein refolding chaperone